MQRQYHWNVVAMVDTGDREKSHSQTVMTHSRDPTSAQHMFKECLDDLGWDLVEFDVVQLKGSNRAL